MAIHHKHKKARIVVWEDRDKAEYTGSNRCFDSSNLANTTFITTFIVWHLFLSMKLNVKFVCSAWLLFFNQNSPYNQYVQFTKANSYESSHLWCLTTKRMEMVRNDSKENIVRNNQKKNEYKTSWKCWAVIRKNKEW